MFGNEVEGMKHILSDLGRSGSASGPGLVPNFPFFWEFLGPGTATGDATPRCLDLGGLGIHLPPGSVLARKAFWPPQLDPESQ